jgi:hypothetical protein
MWLDGMAGLVEVQAEYQTRLDALRDNLVDSATAQALRAICELDLSVLEIGQPRGFGRNT